MFFGLFTGSIVGWLLAPRSGSETREMLRERGLNVKDRIEDLTSQFRVAVNQTPDRDNGPTS